MDSGGYTTATRAFVDTTLLNKAVKSNHSQADGSRRNNLQEAKVNDMVQD